MTTQEKQKLLDTLANINSASFADLDDFREAIWKLADVCEALVADA